jgi:hypothetical protein
LSNSWQFRVHSWPKFLIHLSTSENSEKFSFWLALAQRLRLASSLPSRQKEEIEKGGIENQREKTDVGSAS